MGFLASIYRPTIRFRLRYCCFTSDQESNKVKFGTYFIDVTTLLCIIPVSGAGSGTGRRANAGLLYRMFLQFWFYPKHCKKGGWLRLDIPM